MKPFGFFFIGGGYDHLLDFLELMDQVESLRVLAIGPGFTAKAGALGNIFFW
jgi:hypothetical protein